MRSIFLSIVLVVFLTIVFAMQSKTHSFFNPKLKSYCDSVLNESELIDSTRLETLNELIAYAKTSLKKDKKCQLMFICTHNSRRSQFGQVWAATAIQYYGIENINTFSGGIEVTACNTRTVAALERVGFLVSKNTEEVNPHYTVMAGYNVEVGTLFSKHYNHTTNPKEKFAAIMVCGDADKKCPIVFGAEERISLPYIDPKAFDNTNQEAMKYDERCRQIAREIFYVFSKLQ